MSLSTKKCLSRRTSKSSRDTSKSAPYSLPRMLNFSSDSSWKILPKLLFMIIHQRKFADETCCQIVFPVHLQVDHEIRKDFSLFPAKVFDVHHPLFSPRLISLSSNLLFSKNFRFLTLCFILINRFRHQPEPVSVKENLGHVHVGYTHIQTNTRFLGVLWNQIYQSQCFFLLKRK